jgi:hypothetical protein
MGSVQIGLGVFGKDFGLGFRAPRTILPSRGRELLEKRGRRSVVQEKMAVRRASKVNRSTAIG